MSDDDWEAQFDKEEADEAARLAELKLQDEKLKAKKTDKPASAVEAFPSLSDPSVNYRVKTHLKLSDDDNVALDDPVLESRRRERLNKKAEAQLFGDLLDGCEVDVDLAEFAPDVLKGHTLATTANARGTVQGSLESIPLKNITDCKNFIIAISTKIRQSPAKSPAWLEFLSGLVNVCAPKMEQKDLVTLKNKILALTVDQEADKKSQALSKRKANDSVRSQMLNYKQEYNMLYGEEEEEDDELDDEDDDGFM